MQQEDRSWGWIAGGLAVLTALRLWICTTFDLIGDEAYYWQWSRHLDWCYYSKGPLVAWTIRLGTLIFGNTVLGIRFFSVCFGTGTLLLLYWLTRRLFSRRVALWTLVLAACTPLFVVGSLLMTIDPLFIFFWLASACLFWRAKHTDRIGPWLLTGLLVGLGMLAKYTSVALLPSFALFLAWSKPYRGHLRRANFWLMCLVALACLAPVVWWNARHDWITFVHLQERGALDRAWRFSVPEFLQYVVGQLAAYGPLFFIGIVFSLIHGRIRQNAPVAYRFLASLIIPLLVFYSILALNDAGEANWTAAAIISALPLLAGTWCALSATSRVARTLTWVALAPAVLLAAVLLAAPATRIPRVEALLYRIRGWQDLARRVEQFNEAESLSFVIGDHYQTASLLAFYMADHPDTFIVDRPRVQNQYSLWPTYGDKEVGQDALYVTRESLPPNDLRQQFTAIDPPKEIWSQRDGKPVRKFFLHPCRGYHGDG
ncbi:MAG: glycosyltransferase family 39 protein [Kiritimatiellae bacterium]|nr:glycosyltransferase family 39 protein [Kiritimatiellia bacterium]